MRCRGLILLLLVGCAGASPRKLSAEEAFGAPADDATSRASLEEATANLTRGADDARRATPRGAPMPPEREAAWRQFLTAVGRHGDTAASARAHAREVLVSELERDQSAFGDVPAALAEDILRAARALAPPPTKAVAASPAVETPAEDRFLWPVQPVVFNSAFGARAHPVIGGTRFHQGLDLQADLAQPVHAAAGGVVTFSGWRGGYGKQIEVRHDAHLTTSYSHLLSLLVPPGARVHAGDVIGLAGATGLATGPHLHFELMRDGEAIDPAEALPWPGPAHGRWWW